MRTKTLICTILTTILAEWSLLLIQVWTIWYTERTGTKPRTTCRRISLQYRTQREGQVSFTSLSISLKSERWLIQHFRCGTMMAGLSKPQQKSLTLTGTMKLWLRILRVYINSSRSLGPEHSPTSMSIELTKRKSTMVCFLVESVRATLLLWLFKSQFPLCQLNKIRADYQAST